MIGRLGGGIEVENKLTQLSRSSKQDGWAAQIALARLRAEAKSSEPSEQVDIFLKELGISLSRLRQAGWESAITDAPISFETMALRELADMIAKANRRGVSDELPPFIGWIATALIVTQWRMIDSSCREENFHIGSMDEIPVKLHDNLPSSKTSVGGRKILPSSEDKTTPLCAINIKGSWKNQIAFVTVRERISRVGHRQ